MIKAHSLNGLLRLRATKNGKNGVVEIRSHLFPGSWTWCVYRSLPLEKAEELFENQCVHHTNPNQFFQPIVQPGV